MDEMIVKKLVKVDLHIHSCASIKDKDRVVNNTVDNIPVLVKNLKDNHIDVVSITDHNTFDYNIYKELKKYEGKGLLKVLPGIEFDVKYYGKRIHVVTIFDDSNDKAISEIKSKIMVFDDKNCYTEQRFKSILKDIDLNVLLIAHQKNDVRADNQNENLAQVGQEIFNELIGIDYFDAVEFRSGKVEGMLKDYQQEQALTNLKYITGSDCHVWSVYPKQDEKDTTDVQFSYLKCLPTFKGLVMSLTEPKRVSTSKYDILKPFIEEIDINVDGILNKIPLSSGLNVIIGDNSIGKSLILDSLLDPNFKNVSSTTKINGYKLYLKRNKMKIIPFSDNNIKKIQYDCQGNIRTKFQNGTKLKDVDFFKDKFLELDTMEIENKINDYVERTIKVIKNNQIIEDIESKLDFELPIPCDIEDFTYRLRIIDNLDNPNVYDYNTITNKIKLIIKNLLDLCKLPNFTDSKTIKKIISMLNKLSLKYTIKKENETNIFNIKTIIKTICNKYEKSTREKSETHDNVVTKYNQDIIEAKNRIDSYISEINKEKLKILDNFEDIIIESKVNPFGEYNFLTCTLESKIDKKCIEKILTEPLSNISSLDKVEILNSNDFEKKIKKTCRVEGKDSIFNYKNAISNFIDKKILFQQTKILYKDSDISDGYSPGKNALIYLDIIADDKTKKMYVVDQPGDDISHNKLGNEVIEIMRRMSENKQVLFVTHKPELVVNLDADNVIILKQDEDKRILIKSGALEFEDRKTNTNILKDVADILDGGADSIRKRWKRYDK